MAKITDLPVELLHNILLLIDSSVVDCTTVCWKFNQIATPVLYRDLELRSIKGAIRFPVLLKTIIHRPCLGEYVRFVRIDLGKYYFPPSLGDQNPDETLIWTAAAASYGLSQETQQALQHGSPFAMFVLLLFYLPVLHQLDIIELPDVAPEILHLNPLPPGLQSVRCVRIRCVRYSPWLIPFLSLPALDTFMVARSLLNWVRPDDITLLPCSSIIKHIKLLCCVIPYSVLETIIHLPRSLRTFSFKHPSPRPSRVTFHAPTLGNTLRECALSTLEHLELDFYRDTLGRPQSLGLLSDFVHLTHIRAQLSFLLDYPLEERGIAAARRLSGTLPESLTSLVVSLDGYWASEYWIMKAFVEIKHERLVHLNTLTIFGVIPMAELKEIELACVAKGVEFRMGV